MKEETVSTLVGGKEVTLSTGKLAKQAGGSIVVRCGDTMVLVTAVVSPEPKENCSFLPLSVDYVEKSYAAGKIPGGFFKREGRPSEKAILTSRFIDRPIRPLFPEGYSHETQVIATVLSADAEVDADVLAIVGASAALSISEAPFKGPIAGVRVCKIEGEFVCNPSPEAAASSTLDLVVVGSQDAIVMVEGGAQQVPEAEVISAIFFAHEAIKPLIEIQNKLAKKLGKKKITVEAKEIPADIVASVKKEAEKRMIKVFSIAEKHERYEAKRLLKQEVLEKLIPQDDTEGKGPLYKEAYGQLEYNTVRGMTLASKKRIDGRGYKDIRNITCETSLLPRSHGSALFTRGETQGLVTVTLGSGRDEQIIDALEGEWKKRFILHYNFPPYSVGEVKFLRSPGRREVGHGALAERALSTLLPGEEEFPYTIRIVSEILESNGSSSMATVCGGSLALMDAGVPIKNPVAGIAMGLIKEGKQIAILSDILGDEDHLGDMDFKVTGTENGVTALQMDIKIDGVSQELLTDALEQAREGRLHILGEMQKGLAATREKMSPHAPRIETIQIDKEMIGALIGPGGKNIRAICDDTGAQVEVGDEGLVKVFAVDAEAMNQARERVEGSTAVAEVGKIYTGKVVKIADFGAFVQILPNTDGLLHISEIDYTRVNKVTDVLNEGDEVQVKVVRIENGGKVALSRKDTMPVPEGWTPPPPREKRPPRRDDRGGRDRGPSRGR